MIGSNSITMNIYLTDDSLIKLVQWDRVCRYRQKWPILKITDYISYIYNYGKLKRSIHNDYLYYNMEHLRALFDQFPGQFVAHGTKIYFYGNANITEIIEWFDMHRSRPENSNTIGHSGKWIRPMENTKVIYMYHYDKIVFNLNLYPTIDSIIGNFELSYEAMVYNGIDYVCTPIGIISRAIKICIIDLTKAKCGYDTRLYDTYETDIATIMLELNKTINRHHYDVGSLSYDIRGYLSTSRIYENDQVALEGYSQVCIPTIRAVYNESSNLSLSADTFRELFTNSLFVHKDNIKNIFTSFRDEISRDYIDFIYTTLSKDDANELIMHMCNTINTDRAAYDPPIDNPLGINNDVSDLDRAIEKATDTIFDKVLKLSKITYGDVQTTIGIPVAEGINPVHWYKSNYKDVGLDNAVEIFRSLDESSLSDNIKFNLSNVMYDVLNKEATSIFFPPIVLDELVDVD